MSEPTGQTLPTEWQLTQLLASIQIVAQGDEPNIAWDSPALDAVRALRDRCEAAERKLAALADAQPPRVPIELLRSLGRIGELTEHAPDSKVLEAHDTAMALYRQLLGDAQPEVEREPDAWQTLDVRDPKQEKPPVGLTVISTSGPVLWDGKRWLSRASDHSMNRPLTWEVLWWAPFPTHYRGRAPSGGEAVSVPYE